MSNYAIVNQENCIACGSCISIAPQIFEAREDGVASIHLDDNKGTVIIPKDLEDDLIDAFEDCPSESIKISKEPFDGNPEKFE